MPTTRQYAQAVNLQPTDAIVLDRIGVGTLFIEADEFMNAPALNILVYTGVSQFLAAGESYGVPSAAGAFSLALPALSTVTPGQGIRLVDLNNDVGVNHVTLTSNGTDQILDHGSFATTFVWAYSNTILELFAISTGWRVISYGA